MMRRLWLSVALPPLLGVLLAAPTYSAGRRYGPAQSPVQTPVQAPSPIQAPSPVQAPQMVTRTIMVPETKYELRTVKETVYKPVQRQKTVPLTRMVQELSLIHI